MPFVFQGVTALGRDRWSLRQWSMARDELSFAASLAVVTRQAEGTERSQRSQVYLQLSGKVLACVRGGMVIGI
jgi:hypothetical protein